MSTDDEERLTPLGVAVNGQDQPEISPASHHHLADHHVIARTGSARRHRQGPQAARTRGRREATSLARCRAQIEHRTRDGRRIRRCRARCHLRERRSGQQSRPAHTQQPAAQSGAKRVPVADSDLRREQNQIVRIKWVRISVTSARTLNARCRRERRPHRQRHCHRQRWRERPLRTGAGPLEARAPGSLTPWFQL